MTLVRRSDGRSVSCAVQAVRARRPMADGARHAREASAVADVTGVAGTTGVARRRGRASRAADGTVLAALPVRTPRRRAQGEASTRSARRGGGSAWVMRSSGDSGTSGRRRRRGRPQRIEWSSPRCSATHAPVTRTHSGWLRERGAPGGARNGESVSISRRSAGTSATASAEASSPRRKTSPEKLTARPRSMTVRA